MLWRCALLGTVIKLKISNDVASEILKKEDAKSYHNYNDDQPDQADSCSLLHDGG